jgi:hypothetical protein
MRVTCKLGGGLWFLVALALVPSVASVPATAATCGQRAELVNELTAALHQQQRAVGLTQTGSLAEVFVSPEGEWTLMVSSPHGLSCIIARGVQWTMRDVPQPEA